MNILNQPISVLKFNARIMNCLERWHIHPSGVREMDDKPLVFVRDLVVLPENQLRKVPNFGAKSYREVKSILALHHLTLGMDLAEFEKAEEWLKKEAEYLKKEKVKQLETKTLRDYFAAKAIQGLCECYSNIPSILAEKSYEIADAMMKARDVTTLD